MKSIELFSFLHFQTMLAIFQFLHHKKTWIETLKAKGKVLKLKDNRKLSLLHSKSHSLDYHSYFSKDEHKNLKFWNKLNFFNSTKKVEKFKKKIINQRNQKKIMSKKFVSKILKIPISCCIFLFSIKNDKTFYIVESGWSWRRHIQNRKKL